MESNHETQQTEPRSDHKLSTERPGSSDPAATREETHHGSDAAFPPTIVPAYKNDQIYNHESNLEVGNEKLPDETKLVDSSSIESARKIEATDEIGGEDEYPPSWMTRTWRKYRTFGHVIIWLLVTAYAPDEGESLKVDGGSVVLSCTAING